MLLAWQHHHLTFVIVVFSFKWESVTRSISIVSEALIYKKEQRSWLNIIPTDAAIEYLRLLTCCLQAVPIRTPSQPPSPSPITADRPLKLQVRVSVTDNLISCSQILQRSQRQTESRDNRILEDVRLPLLSEPLMHRYEEHLCIRHQSRVKNKLKIKREK